MPESAAVNIRNRSYSIAVEVNIESPDAGRAILGASFTREGDAMPATQ